MLVNGNKNAKILTESELRVIARFLAFMKNINAIGHHFTGGVISSHVTVILSIYVAISYERN